MDKHRATPERWQAALARAIAESLKVFHNEETGRVTVVKYTALTGYVNPHITDGVRCDCQAGQSGDPVCKHRAMFWHSEGILDLDAATPMPVVVPCYVCNATGRNRRSGRRPNYEPCTRCKGTGYVVSDPPAVAESDPDLANAKAELDRLESLHQRHQLKSSADFRNLHAARERVAELTSNRRAAVA